VLQLVLLTLAFVPLSCALLLVTPDAQVSSRSGNDQLSTNAAPLIVPVLAVNMTGGRHLPSFGSPWDPLLGWGLPRMAPRLLKKDERTQLLCRLKQNFPVRDVQSLYPHRGKCAVVSNSGVMSMHQHGQSIDAADAVFRFNLAPVGRKYGRNVGSKESYRIVNNGVPMKLTASRHLNLSESMVEQVMVLPVDAPHTSSMAECRRHTQVLQGQFPQKRIEMVEREIFVSSKTALMSIYDTDWFKDHADDGVKFDPTSGLFGMLSALSVCDRVTAYGMAATPRGEQGSYHYYNDEWPEASANENPWHKTFPAEKDLWRRLAMDANELDRTDMFEVPGFSQLDC